MLGIHPFQGAAKFFAVGMHLALGRSTNRGLEGDIHQLPSKALKIDGIAQQAVNSGGRDFQALVIDPINFQGKLQLACDFFTVFDRDERLW